MTRKNMTGDLYANPRPRDITDSDADYCGKLTVDGKHYRLYGWLCPHKTKRGKFMELSVVQE